MPIPRQNYIYVDFENIQEVDINLIAQRPVKVVIALGKRQTTLSVGMVKSLLRHPDQVELVEVGVEGKNALDFVLAYYIGQQTSQDPQGYFHILSRDKGFDSLVEHLRAQKILIKRHDSFADIEVLREGRFLKALEPIQAEEPPKSPPVIRMVKPPTTALLPIASVEESKPRAEPRAVVKATPAAKSPPASASSNGNGDRFSLLKDNLAKNRKNRPARRVAFLSHIQSFYGNKLSEAECERVFQRLISEGVISVNPQNQIEYRS